MAKNGAPEGARIVVEIANARVARQPSRIAKENKFDFTGVVPGSYVIEGLAMQRGQCLEVIRRRIEQFGCHAEAGSLASGARR